MIKIVAGLVAVFAAASTVWWMEDGSLNGSEKQLFDRVNAALVDKPPSAKNIAEAFELRSECATKGCFFDQSKIGGIISGEGRLHPEQEGLVFVLEKISGQCVRTSMLARKFGQGEINQACAHGGCWYYDVQHDWGVLAFGLESPSAACVSSVVINSLPYQRPRQSRK